MKNCSWLFFIAIGLTACSQSPQNDKILQAKVDSLEKKLNDVYKPGLGEFMSSIQVHHAKLWFAGRSNNWKLADFEIHEIMEAVDDIKQYAADREEVKVLPMLLPALDSIDNAIEKKDKPLFEKQYTVLTNTCNSCHTTVHYEFNKVKIPDSPPLSNQVFEVKP